MKTLIAAVVLSMAVPYQANAGGNFDDSEMLAAGVLGAIIGGQVVRNRQAPTVIQAPAQPIYQAYPEYYETRSYYYESYHRPMYRSVDIWIPECGCYRTVRVRVQ